MLRQPGLALSVSPFFLPYWFSHIGLIYISGIVNLWLNARTFASVLCLSLFLPL